MPFHPWKRTAQSSPSLIKKNRFHMEPVLVNGASDEARTRYLHLGKVALYQMSYTRNSKGYYSRIIQKVKP